jgi:DNA invertase Pin-like site-specific DNA recombinase
MNANVAQKVTSRHLQRLAYLYVRQSTLRQVLENSESTARQYALRERAVVLGWPPERVLTIDCDLGQSGASAVDRAGFQKLVAEVGLARVGIVLGLEVSRLARSSADWHHLLEICALTGTLILDEDGLYDPAAFNDRLLLGLKGTMSEAELHVLQARLHGGLRNKASRGALKLRLPLGLVYAEDDSVILDPDQQVQQAVRLFFATFRRTASAYRTLRFFRERGLSFPRRLGRGLGRGELVWGPLAYDNALNMLHNPRYAGAYVFGRTHTFKTVDGKVHVENRPREEWHTLLPAAHASYISWAEFEQNLERLRCNRQLYAAERRLSPAREGPALLQGLVICGVCGGRMSLRYHKRAGQAIPDYICQKESVTFGTDVCQRVPGKALDPAIGALLVATMTPLALELALGVQDEINARLAEADRLRQQQIERARYEAELAQRRYLRVDPDNRLVAEVLEAEWNAKLRALAEAQAVAEQQRVQDQYQLSATERMTMAELPQAFARFWHDPHTANQERKRVTRLLIEDVTVEKAEQIVAHVRFKGGASRTLMIALPPPFTQSRLTPAETLSAIDRLLDTYTDAEVAEQLNAQGERTFAGLPFHAMHVSQLCRKHGLKDRYTRLREAGMLTAEELAKQLGVRVQTIWRWYHDGQIAGARYNDRGTCLFLPPEVRPHRRRRKAT